MTQTRRAQISDRCTKAGGKTVRAGPRFSHLHNSRLVAGGWGLGALLGALLGGLCWGALVGGSVGALRVSRTFTIAGSGLGGGSVGLCWGLFAFFVPS